MDIAIRTWALTKRYGGRPAPHDLDLTVPARQVYGYLGPNGPARPPRSGCSPGCCGPAPAGAEIGGHDVVAERERAQRQIGYLPGDFAGYPDLTARSYLDYLGSLRGGVDPACRRALADRLGLDLGLRIGAMSHGTRQKAGIVQAFMHRPAVLVLDEPTGGLDPLVQREFLGMVREVRQDGRCPRSTRR